MEQDSPCYYKKPLLAGTQELTTEHLDLRRFKERDAAAAYEWSSDGQILKYFQGNQFNNVDEARSAIASWRVQYKNDNFLVWCIQEAETKRAIGKISANVDVPVSSAEIEYSIAPDARGKGYAPEAMKAVMEYLHYIGVHRVYARINTENHASSRVVEKAGMTLEGICSDMLVDRNGKFYDVAIYAHID